VVEAVVAVVVAVVVVVVVISTSPQIVKSVPLSVHLGRFLLEYFMTDDKSKTFFHKVRDANISKVSPFIFIFKLLDSLD